MAWSQLCSLLKQVGLAVVPTPADGHCLLHVVKRSWTTQVKGTAPTMEMLLSAVHQEALVNNGRYKDFFCGPFTQYKKQMYSYLSDKIFNRTFVDLVPLMLCNRLNIGICIFNEDSCGKFTFFDVVPSHGKQPMHVIYVHRKLNHYSALELNNFRDSVAVPSKASDTEWKAVPCSRQAVHTQVTMPATVPVVTQNRYSCLNSEGDFPALSKSAEGNIIEKASTKCISKHKSIKARKSKTLTVNHSNLVEVKPNSLPTGRRQQLKSNDVIVIGTSLVRGVGSLLNGDNLNVLTYTNAGCSIRHIAPRLKQMVPENYKGSLVFQMGGNDCDSEKDSEFVVNAYDNFLNDVKMYVPDAHIFVSAIPPRRGSEYLNYKIRTVNEFLHFRATFDSKITFIDCILSNEKLHFSKDGVHFSPQGKALYVSNVKRVISQVFYNALTSRILR